LLPGLTYWNDRKRFLNEVEFRESIIEIKDESILSRHEETQHPFFKHPKWAQLPEVYFKWGGKGYELGLEVQAQWWEELCKSGRLGELSKIKPNTDYLCGTTRIPIAILPYAEFAPYYQEIPYNDMKKHEDATNKLLGASGWERKHDDENSEIRDRWTRVEHKYFAVAHRTI
jgi:hypothetical protein